MELTEPLEAPVVNAAQIADCAVPKRTSLPSMLPPIDAHGVHQRIAGGLRPVGGGAPDGDEQHHDGEQRPALALLADHAPEGDGEAEREREDGPGLDRCWSRRWGSRRGAPSSR